MIQLPEDFVELMHRQYDAGTADALCEALVATEPEVSVRLNMRKLASVPHLAGMCSCIRECDPVPWCEGAFYLSERPPFTFDPMLHAGAYYVQEASSMYIAKLLDEFIMHDSPLAALDLCAAPGGKSTLLAGMLPEGSLLVSNEPVPKRAQVLAENMQKWTRQAYPVGSIVTNNYPADFVAFTDSFDVVVTDVPCSGEGMFRKDEQAVAEWSLDNVMMCQARQRGILQDIWHALKPGGVLIYSTCTFNRFEDEDNAVWICDVLGGDLLEQRHFLPGRDRGEGFYCCMIRKMSTSEITGERNMSDIRIKAERTLRVMPMVFELEGPAVDLSYDQALQYLRREALRVPAERGMVTLCYNGLPLGPGKCVGNRINNLYPEQWRIRTTYTRKWSLFENS